MAPLVFPPRPAHGQQPAAVPLAFTDVTVVDVRSGQRVSGQTVVVSENRVQTVGAARSVRVPQGATVVDGRGKFLIPGLWDMHVHVWSQPDIFYPLLVANGVTGIREMSTPFLDSLLKWRREIRTGRRVGPRVVGTGGFLTTSDLATSINGSMPGLAVGVDTPEEARRAVDSLKAAGVDFIKVRDGMTREVYFAAIAAARRAGLPFVGHTPVGVMADESADSGQRSIDHIHDNSFKICGAPEDSAEAAGPAPASFDITANTCRAFAARLVRNPAWIVPTIAVLSDWYARAPDRLRYWRATAADRQELMQRWSARGSSPEPEVPNLRAVGTMWRLGVRILAGTDVGPSPELTAGFSLHDELALLVAGGMTPLGALQAATINPAEYLSAADSLGTVAPGRLADLVLLDADPLDDIANTTKIRAVVSNGRYFDRAALDGLLATVERTANR